MIQIGDKVRHYALGEGVVFYNTSGQMMNRDGTVIIFFRLIRQTYSIDPTNLEIWDEEAQAWGPGGREREADAAPARQGIPSDQG